MNFNGFTIVAKKEQLDKVNTGWENEPTIIEELRLYVRGSDPSILKDFINAAIDHIFQEDGDKIGMYVLHMWGFWTKASTKRARTMESVILDDGVAENMMADMRQFLDSAKWYAEKGVPYRRGYLLYGPPGTGKSSFTQAVAGKMKLNLCHLNLSGNSIRDDDHLNYVLNSTPAQSIILLEDIDSIFHGRESVQKSRGGGGVTFSGLLNALDGIRSQEGRIIFMTTNHREKLDPAILRPGRADYHVHLDNASYNQQYRMFLKFNPGATAQATEFARAIPDKKLSMAKLQGHFLKYKDDPSAQLENAAELYNGEDQDGIEEMTIIEWLRRLNLVKYATIFKKKKIFWVTDLRWYPELDDEGLKDIEEEDKIRMNKVVDKSDEQLVEDF